MLRAAKWLKYRLTHISQNSLHYQIVELYWGSRAQGKACSYYWIKLPTSVVGLLITFVIIAVFVPLSLFVGYVPTLFGDLEKWHSTNKLTYPYKQLPNGKKVWLAPWEFVFILWTLWVIYSFLVPYITLDVILDFGGFSLRVIGVIISLFLIAWIFAWGFESIVKFVRRMKFWIKPTWDRICPPLVVEED